MEFDVVIIGGGLSGLVCGLKVAAAGKSCAIVSSGHSALSFFSGSFDLLGNSGRTDTTFAAIKKLTEGNPGHPYSKIGAENVIKLADEAKLMLAEYGIVMNGSSAQNHFRITPLGLASPTWLTTDGFIAADCSKKLPYKKILAAGIKGFLDAYPNMLADGLKKLGADAVIAEISLEKIIPKCSEMTTTRLSGIFSYAANLEYFADQIRKTAQSADAVLVPACAGIADSSARRVLEERVGVPVRLAATFPPQAAGALMWKKLRAEFMRKGGVIMDGDIAANAEEDRDHVRIHTRNHGKMPLFAKNLILASGGFFGKGLVSTAGSVFEPVAGADVDFEKDASKWSDNGVGGDHHYMRFGVKTDKNFNVIKNSETKGRMYAVGALLGGFNALKEKSGGGISLVTALHVAKLITGKTI